MYYVQMMYSRAYLERGSDLTQSPSRAHCTTETVGWLKFSELESFECNNLLISEDHFNLKILGKDAASIVRD